MRVRQERANRFEPKLDAYFDVKNKLLHFKNWKLTNISFILKRKTFWKFKMACRAIGLYFYRMFSWVQLVKCTHYLALKTALVFIWLQSLFSKVIAHTANLINPNQPSQLVHPNYLSILQENWSSLLLSA